MAKIIYFLYTIKISIIFFYQNKTYKYVFILPIIAYFLKKNNDDNDKLN